MDKRDELIKKYMELSKTFPGAKERYETSEMCGLSWGELRIIIQHISSDCISRERKLVERIVEPLRDECVLHDNTFHGNAWAVNRYRNAIEQSIAIADGILKGTE